MKKLEDFLMPTQKELFSKLCDRFKGFLQGCSEDIVIFRADGGNHFTDYGIYEGMFLFFDRKKRFKKGRLSCYINTAGDDRPKYRVSDKNIDGYKHLGRLVLTLRNYEV